MGDGVPVRRSSALATTLLSAGAVLIGLAVLATVMVIQPWRSGSENSAPTPTMAAEPAPEAVLASSGASAPAVTAAQVEAAIGDLVPPPELGDRVAVAVTDLYTGERLYEHDATSPLIPASSIKLVTAVTVLAEYGPAHRFTTTALAGAEPGEVVLVGGGDPTLAVDGDGFYPGAARLDLLAAQVRSALGDTEVTKVTVDAGLFTGPVHGPWTPDIPVDGYVGPITALLTDGTRKDPTPTGDNRSTPRWDEPDLQAGKAFAELLGAGQEAPAPAVERGAATSDAAELGEVASPPLQRTVDFMLTTSDNVVAEVLARQVALARGEPASYAGAGAAMTQVVTELVGDSAAEITIADGSGLSRDNLLTARLYTDLLTAAVGEPELSGLFSGLPVAGWSGTLADRHATPPPDTVAGLGVVRAKTGSLNGVDALAGVVVTSQGRPLAFALIADQVPTDHSAARAALDRIPAALASL